MTIENNLIDTTPTEATAQEQPTACEQTADKPENPISAEQTTAEPNMTKAVSEAVNRASERYRRKLEQNEKMYTELSAELVRNGLAADLPTAVKQIAAIRRSEPFDASVSAERDSELLGRADAQDVIKLGDDEVKQAVERLEHKPVAARTKRDRYCWRTLREHLASAGDREELAKSGVDFDTLMRDTAFNEFASKLDKSLSCAEKYSLYRKYAAPRSEAHPPESAASSDSEVSVDFITPEQVDAMTPDEIEKNLDRITASMPKWGRRRR